MPVVDALVPVVEALVLAGGELVVVVGLVADVDVVDLLVELGLELEVDCGGWVVEEVLEWVRGGGVVFVCELLRAGVEP